MFTFPLEIILKFASKMSKKEVVVYKLKLQFLTFGTYVNFTNIH